MRQFLQICALLFLCAANPAWAQQRVALVVGESAYTTVSPLANPGADANLIANALARAGFDVRLGLDLDKAALESALDDFAHDAQQADVAAVYFAGHGFETQGRNWLAPVDTRIAVAEDVARTAVPFEAVARALAGAKVKIVALDACRNNPFATRAAAEGGAINRGLAEVELDGYVIVYAAAVGAVALDGQTNSPFAQSFARWVSEPNVDLRLLAGKIRDDVSATTGGRQRPFVSASLSGDVTALTPAPAGRVRGAAVTRERPSAYFEFVRRVQDENCFQTRTVKCDTKGFGVDDNRLYTWEDDGKLRVWDGAGATLQRADTMPEAEGSAYADGANAMAFMGPVLEQIGVNTTVEVLSLDGRRTRGVIRHIAEEPKLLLATGPQPVAVIGHDNACRFGFFDLRTFRALGEAVWGTYAYCGGEAHWIYADDAGQRLIASVTTGDRNLREVLLLSIAPARIDCRFESAAADAAFDGAGVVHVAGDGGAIVAYDRQCRAVRTDRLHRAEVQDIYPFDATRMLSRSVDGVLKVWGAANGRVERELTGLPRGARIQFISDAGTVLILNEDKRLYAWSGEPRLGAYVGPSEPVCRGVLSQDANTLYALKCNGALEVWRRRGGG